MQTLILERSIVGAALIAPATLHAARLEPSDFDDPQLAAAWSGILEVEASGRAVDLVSLRRVRPGLPVEWLAGLTDGLPRVSPAVVGAWADDLRAVRASSRLAVALAKAGQAGSLGEQLKAAEEAVAAATRESANRSARHIGTLTRDVLAGFERLAEHGAASGLLTGFKGIDAILCGLRPGELIIIAGRPGMGKSSLASQVVTRSAARTLFVSLEMSGAAICRRMVASEAEVNQRAIQYGLRERQWHRLTAAFGAIHKMPIWIDESASTVGAIRSSARRLEKIELIVVDYLQLMEGDGGRGANRQEQVAGISRGLKKLASELHVPIVALSQLSRPADQRKDKRPQLTDLRESGALEQDADVVLLIYREDAHNPTDDNRGKVDLIVAKQRDGDTGTVKLRWEKSYTRFDDEPTEPEAEEPSTPTQESLL